MKKGFIPVEAIVGKKYRTWYMDVSNLTIKELVELKKELRESKIDSVASLDAIIHDIINYDVDKSKMIRREMQKEKAKYRNSKALIRMKKRGR